MYAVQPEESTNGDAVIDLDVAPPPRADAARGPRTRAGGPVVAAVVVLLAALSLGGGAAPRQGLIEVMAVGRGGTAAFTLDPSALYTAEFNTGPDGWSTVRRYALDDGAEQWAVPVEQNVADLQVQRAAQVLVVRSNHGRAMTLLDAGTGRRLWQNTDAGVVTVEERTVLLLIPGTDGGSDRLRLADLRTGRTLWSRSIGVAALVDAGRGGQGRHDFVMTLSTGGSVTVYSMADGAVEATADLDLAVQFSDSAGEADFDEVTVTTDRLYVARHTGGRSSLTAYRLADLDELWRTSGRPVGAVTDCAPVVCVSGTELTALHPANGAVRWVTPRWGHADQARTGRIFALDGRSMSEAALLDPATGRVVRELGNTVGAGDLLLRSDRTVLGRTWVSTGGTDFVGSLDTVLPRGCSAAGRHLACPTVDGPTTVWRLPDRSDAAH